MGKSLTQHPAVRTDLSEIHGYIAADDPVAADRVIDAIKGVFQMLTQFPQTGRIYSRSGIERLRVMQVPKYRNYLVFYQDTPGAVRVLYILHGAQDLAEIFQTEKRDESRDTGVH